MKLKLLYYLTNRSGLTLRSNPVVHHQFCFGVSAPRPRIPPSPQSSCGQPPASHSSPFSFLHYVQCSNTAVTAHLIVLISRTSTITGVTTKWNHVHPQVAVN
ncbi:uncharacterized protein LOC135107461 [Scylla paramamosain]|uniref:uncharacterized protein LOC135107461 n=1 Tax=Scylla paramamosain TaxID=85552 RepID=UPI003082BB6E